MKKLTLQLTSDDHQRLKMLAAHNNITMKNLLLSALQQSSYCSGDRQMVELSAPTVQNKSYGGEISDLSHQINNMMRMLG